ncbi:hypothetical protein C8Q74DRAFT_672811 [Fomes fomentarius]|nr:hypothetical protein C8Q74DRAFT_672811 [Fomes fomentarius]
MNARLTSPIVPANQHRTCMQCPSLPLSSTILPALVHQSDRYHDSKIVMNAWINELRGRVLVDDRPVEDFIDLFVPCSESASYTASIVVPRSPFWAYWPQEGKEEENYKGLNIGLTRLVENFPAEHRPSFCTTKGARFALPFPAFAKDHCDTSPDISFSFPGDRRFDQRTLARHKWHKIAGIIDTKDTDTKDPFSKAGESHTSTTIIRMARNARTLMLTHGFLATFMLGIYGDVGRIVRFDRTCGIVSQPFNIRTQPELLHRFFWHWTHSRVGTTVVGADPTVRRLTADEEKWLSIQLERRSGPFERTFIQPDHYRRVEVYNERDNSMTAYFAYKLVQGNARLLSRSTTVWKVVEDRYSQDPDALEPVKTCILKDSWRQLVRESESLFYARLSSTIPKENYFGIARFVCGGDLGRMEMRQWETTSPNADFMEDERELRLGMPPGDLRNEEESSTAENTESIGEDTASTPPNPHGPLPYPQHQTFSWTIMEGADYAYLERSHMRFVVENVGRPLTEFKSTKQVVRAMMDALKGHKLAWEVAGVLHRDVSIGNILITDEATTDGCHGFIHDFDYSSMESRVPPGEDDEASSEDLDDRHKERLGTHYFIAYEILCEAGTVIHRH